MITYDLKKGDLFRNKVTGDIAILRAKPYTRFYPDEYHGIGDIESGVATTCYPLTFTVVQDSGHGYASRGIGTTIDVKHTSLLRNWERLCK